jgi:signal transduction histidine kinase
MARTREPSVPRVEVREPAGGSLPRMLGGMPDKLELFWGLLTIRRDEGGDEKISIFWGLLEVRTRRRLEVEPGKQSAAQRAEQRVEAVRAAALFGSLGLGFAFLTLVSDRGFWSGAFGILSALLLALGGGQLLVVFAERFRPRFLREEMDRDRARKRTMAGRHARDIQELTASIAHEIRNPITAAKSLVQQMGEDPNADDNVEYASVALEELERVERSVSHLLRFARDEDVALHAVRLGEVVEGALAMLAERADKEGVELRHELDTDGELEGDPEQLRRVVLNLVGNSLDALHDANTASPRVDVQLGDDLSGSEVWLRVRDNGPGIPADERARIFRPFHTSKTAGTGLGLAITKKIVEAHEGSIEVEAGPGGGAEFLVTLPKQRAG